MKKNKKRMIIFILTLSTNLFVLFFLNYQSIGRTQMLIANGLYSDWSIELTEKYWNKNGIIGNGGRVFIEHTFNGNVRTLINSGDWEPPLLAGEFFTNELYSPVAVVGERISPEVGEHFLFEGKPFKIIGVLGAGFPSVLDNLVLLRNSAKDLPVERIIVDTDSRQLMNTISEEISYRSVFSLQERKRFQTQLRFGRDLFEELMIINTILIITLFVVISSHTFRLMTKENDDILYLQGFTNKEMMVKNHLSLALVFGISFLVVILVNLILNSDITLQNFKIFLGVFAAQQAFYFIIVVFSKLKRRLKYVF